jgi:hypothetical protein
MSEVQETPQAQNLVTSENLQEFNFKKLGIEIPSFTEKTESDTGDGNAEEVIANTVEQEEEHEIAAEEEIEEEKKEEEKPKKQGKFAKRISELTQQRNVERERAAALEARLTALEATKPQVEASDSPMPDPAKYNDQATYNKDYQQWQQKEIQSQARIMLQQERVQAQQQEQLSKWNAKVSDFVKDTPDFSENVQQVSHLAPALERNGVLPMLAQSEYGVQVMDYYARNPDKAESLAKMHPMDAAREIGRHEARFEDKKSAQPVKTVAKSNAPAPITPIKGGKSPDSNYIDAEGNFTGTPAQYRALRKAGKIR